MPAPEPEPCGVAEALDLDAFRRRGLSGRGVRIGHLDSGVRPDHPDLRDRLERLHRFDRCGDAAPPSARGDESGHGTHTAGIACRVAPGIGLRSAQVIEGGYVVWRILKGLDWLIGQRVSVALLPVGLKTPSPVFAPAVTALRRADILPIVAVGNGGAGRACSPGWYPHVLSVGAADRDGGVARFSGSLNRDGRCLKPDIVAPGVAVLSAHPSGGAIARSGTSMASACVAGVAAMLREAAPAASCGTIERSIRAGCVAVDGRHAHRVRLGRFEPAGALRRLLAGEAESGAADEPDVMVFPRYREPRLSRLLEFGGEDEHVATVLVAGGEPSRSIIARASRASGEDPRTQAHLPRFGAALVVATRRFTRRLRDDDAVAVLMLPDADVLA